MKINYKEFLREQRNIILKDIEISHIPRVLEGLGKEYIDENQILVLYDHAVRLRIITDLLNKK